MSRWLLAFLAYLAQSPPQVTVSVPGGVGPPYPINQTYVIPMARTYQVVTQDQDPNVVSPCGAPLTQTAPNNPSAPLVPTTSAIALGSGSFAWRNGTPGISPGVFYVCAMTPAGGLLWLPVMLTNP
jgi:hypothetical protein